MSDVELFSGGFDFTQYIIRLRVISLFIPKYL